jgi:hypothetical protein
MQRNLINAIVSFPGHIIATMRSKTEWQTGAGTDGKKSGPVRVGLAPEQGKGIEYEFTILFELSTEHLAHVIKDRTGKFQDKIIEKPGKEFGRELVDWLNEGVVSLNEQIQAAHIEIGNIIKSKSPSNAPYFTAQEYEIIKTMCKESIKQSQEARFEFLQNVLADQKNILQERIAQFGVAVPEAPVPAQQPSTVPPSKSKKPVPEKDDPSLSESFHQMIRNKELAKQNDQKAPAAADVTTPAMFTEMEDPHEEARDDFEDDIPSEDAEEEAVPADAELDIF